jgi:hypothetical protein
MYYCEDCARKNGWPFHWFLAHQQAICTVCRNDTLCIKYDAMALPQPTKPITEAKPPISEVPLNFPDEPTRRQWIIDHAEYFTVIRRVKRSYERHEFDSLGAARVGAAKLLERDPTAIYMVYAVRGVNDTWVENIKGQQVR